MDAFLMALQGAIFGEARTLAAKHLSETIGDGQAQLADVLTRLMWTNRTDCISACSPFRIDDFRGGSQ